MKNARESINSRTEESENRIHELEDRNFEITQSEENKEERMKKNKEGLHDLWNTIKRINSRIIGVPEGEEKRKGE